jgi:phage tail-like protein
MPLAQRKDPCGNNRFLIEIDGIITAGFCEAIIPDSTSEVIEYREGNEPFRTRKLPGLVKYGNLVLKWGVTDSMVLYNWRKMVEQGKMKAARRNMAIILMDEEGNPVARWEFGNAWPCKYIGPEMNAKGNDVAIETLEVVFESMERVK